MKLQNLVVPLAIIAFVFIVVFFFPWKDISWGKIQIGPAQTITVTGTAQKQEKNQVASFSAGVSSVNDSKEKAIKEVNDKINELVKAIKEFGVEEGDIQTQSISIYQNEERFYEEGKEKYQPGQWRVSNSVNVTLRDINTASEFTTLLSKSGANSVYGPNFSLDYSKDNSTDLLKEAVEDAKKKAQEIANSSGGKLGKLLVVTESGSNYQPLYFMREMGGGGGPSLEPGTGTIYKTVSATFELK